MQNNEEKTMVECPNCHNKLSSINKFCTVCGSELASNVVKETVENVKKEETMDESMYKCPKCGNLYNNSNKFCPKCGNPTDESVLNTAPAPVTETVTIQFDPRVQKSESEMLAQFIKDKMKELQMDEKTKLIPANALKRKKIMNIIYSILLFVYISMIFFHFPIMTYIVGLIILLICGKMFNKYDFIQYMSKQIKARPNEKISNIILNEKNDLVEDNSKVAKIIFHVIAIVLPLILFLNPVIWYEKTDGGYGVRYYLFGVRNFTSAVIPETHNGQPVVTLRGNTFSNMPFLKTVKLPDTVIEIRGEAFKNCISLKEVNLPINLQEIKGSTFENCRSLESIVIPDSVTRIGGHAFYGASKLSDVYISENSKLSEIGSSAFRRCYRLYKITLKRGVYINERAFKESPTMIRYYSDNSRIETSEPVYRRLPNNTELYFSSYDISILIDAPLSGGDSGVAYVTMGDYETKESLYFFGQYKTDSVYINNYEISITRVGEDFQVFIMKNN